MKKILVCILAILLMVGSLVGCTQLSNSAANDTGKDKTSSNATSEDATTSDSTTKDTGSEDAPLRVAVIYSGFLGDKSFNDSAHIGAMQAVEDMGIELKEMESKEPTEWESNFVAMAADGYDLVICISTQFQEIMTKHAPDFPDTKFALIDGVVEGENIVSSTFAQNEGSFLAGAAAALFTTHDEIEGVNPEKVIGWVGGMDIPVLADFFTGYSQGAKYIDPNVTILKSFAGSFNDPLKGKELTIAQYSQGADVVMNVAAGTGTGILEAAKEEGKFAIGVDLDQDSVYPGSVLTSMLKRVDVATYLAITSVINGTYRGNTTTYLDVSNGGVGLTDMSVMKETLGDKFPEDILVKLDEIVKKIKSGEIMVASYEGFGKR